MWLRAVLHHAFVANINFSPLVATFEHVQKCMIIYYLLLLLLQYYASKTEDGHADLHHIAHH
jgi:hypothetical protein